LLLASGNPLIERARLDRVLAASVWRRPGSTRIKARELTLGMLCALEGAFILARAPRSTEPLHVAGEMMAGVAMAATQC
jgi:hypothetical protein